MKNVSMSQAECRARRLHELPDPKVFLEDTKITFTDPGPQSLSGELTLGIIRGNENGQPHVGSFGFCKDPS